ncbi:hypothetical protein EDB80DRAFT_733170 [Ilyonectria destructans]|nr:hypothetical protein EDB80DRAFT_733170 [Ilyonectria destructans]
MDSSSSTADVFASEQGLDSVSSDNILQFLEEHGFFYRKDANIGQLVDGFYNRSCQRDAVLDDFLPALQQDSRLSKILKYYTHVPKFRFPWGTLECYYHWASKSNETAEIGLTFYIVASGSYLVCRDGDFKLPKGKRGDEGIHHVLDRDLEDCTERDVKMDQGGV